MRPIRFQLRLRSRPNSGAHSASRDSKLDLRRHILLRAERKRGGQGRGVKGKAGKGREGKGREEEGEIVCSSKTSLQYLPNQSGDINLNPAHYPELHTFSPGLTPVVCLLKRCLRRRKHLQLNYEPSLAMTIKTLVRPTGGTPAGHPDGATVLA